MRGVLLDVLGVSFGVCLAFCSLLVYAVLCAIGAFLAEIM